MLLVQYRSLRGDHLRGVDLDYSTILKYILKVRCDYMDWTYLVQVINHWLSLEDIIMIIWIS
jgi:hypothetical protein